jgi:hypothetical protein
LEKYEDTGKLLVFFRILRPDFNEATVPERCKSGLIGTPGKRVYFKRVPGVRIPLSPQSQIYPAAKPWDKFDFARSPPWDHDRVKRGRNPDLIVPAQAPNVLTPGPSLLRKEGRILLYY